MKAISGGESFARDAVREALTRRWRADLSRRRER